MKRSILDRLVRCSGGLFAGILITISAHATTSLSQYGITWTWQEDRQTGQFANGDYWVVGPITLSGISPASVVTSSVDTATVTAHGSMINPISGAYPTQGFDSRIMGYSESANIARQGGSPLSTSNTRVIPAGSSICSSSSRLTVSSGAHALLSDFAILTVLSSAPAGGSFRPPYTGADKTIRWNKSQLDYSILKNLSPVAGMSAPTSSAFTRPWMEFALDYNQARDYRAYNNQPEYDRDLGYQVEAALLELHQNYSNAAKELPYVRLVQCGIDIYSAVKNGVDVVNGVTYQSQHGSYYAKAPVVLAALALNDTDIKFYANAANKVYSPWIGGGKVLVNRFAADVITWYVTAGNVGVGTNDGYLSEGRPRYPYTVQMIGLPEWGCESGNITQITGSNWGVIYRNVRYPGLIGSALAMQLTTGAKALWNWPAYFDYFDRAFATYTTGPSDPTESYIKLFWTANRSLGEPVWQQANPISGIGWIPETGNTLSIEYTDNVSSGTGGNGGVLVTASGGAVTASYKSGNGSTQRTFNLSRVVGKGEVVTYSYVQPGNGAEAVIGGADVSSATAVTVYNYSSATGGAAGTSTPPTNAVISISVAP